MTKAPINHGVTTTAQKDTLSCVFDTKEEFITHLIRTKEIKKDSRHHDDGMIYLIGTLKIDGRVKKGLNWSDVVTTSAIVEAGMISRYQYLPKTQKGIKTDLIIPNLELYMLHNNFDTICKDGHYELATLRISSSASHLDFSSVRSKLTLFYGQHIALSHLPKSDNILGLSFSNLEIDCPDAYRVAKEKGCGSEVLNNLKPRSQLVAYVYRLLGKKNF